MTELESKLLMKIKELLNRDGYCSQTPWWFARELGCAEEEVRMSGLRLSNQGKITIDYSKRLDRTFIHLPSQNSGNQWRVKRSEREPIPISTSTGKDAVDDFRKFLLTIK